METLAFITAIIIVVAYNIYRTPNMDGKDELTVAYPNGLGANWQRQIKEKKILEAGYKIKSEESIKKWTTGRLIFLAIPILFPLVFFRSKKIKVIYKK